MLGVDIDGLKTFIREKGLKQNVIANRAGFSESQLSQILQEKRKLEAGEYASLCKALDTPMERFLIKKTGR